MFGRILLGALAALMLLPAAVSAKDISLSKFDVLDATDLVQKSANGTHRVEFAASGRVWSLDLVPNIALEEKFPANVTRLYKGKLSNNPDSWLRLSERNGVLRGLVFDGADFYAVEDASAFGAAKGGASVVFYALADLVVDAGALSCGHTPIFAAKPDVDLNQAAKSIAEELTFVAEQVATQAIEMTVIGDSFFADGRSDPVSDLMDRFNIVDGYFAEQVGVTLNILEYQITAAADEPFTTNDASDLLDELATLKVGDQQLRTRGLVHLFTGRNLDGNTAGIAFRGALCSTRFGVGLSEGRRNLTTDSLIAAHELGHNFGAPHDGEAGSVCQSTPRDFLMAPTINGSSTFSACSLNEIQQEVATANCLVSIQPIDVLPVLRNFPTESTVGAQINGTIDVLNNGTSATTGAVTLTVTPSAELALDSAALPNGCTSAPPGATCTIASLAGGASESFAFGFTALTAAAASITAEIATTDDANAGNDQASFNITVTNVADLSADLSVPAQIALTTNQTITATVNNTSPAPATDVEMVIDIPSELSVQAVDGPCTDNGNQVVCRQTTLAGNASTNFAIVVQGANLGPATVAATVSAFEADPNLGNNSVQRNTEVIELVLVDADVSTTLTGPTSLDTDDRVSYFARATNAGPLTATGVDLTVTLPAVVSVVSVDNTDCSANGNTVTCSFGDIPSGEERIVGIAADGASAGSGSLNATVTSGTPDPDNGNNSTALGVTVSTATSTPAPTGSGGGGGGAATWMLALLAWLALARRRKDVASRHVR
ncbi:MAG: zinc-dependent metalloprotease family protein [Pseudomonadota bacterium]